VDTKRCIGCEQILPLSLFYRSNDFRDGHVSRCKACYAAANGQIYHGIKNKHRELPEGHLLCGKCKQILPYAKFTKCGNKRSGYQSHCKECRNAARRKREKPEVLPEGLKRCFDCKGVFSATTEFFAIDNRSPTGLQGRCKACSSIYRQVNKDRIIQQKKEYYLDNQVEIRTQGRIKYYINHDYLLQCQRERYQENKERIRGYSHKRRTRQLELPYEFSADLWQFCLQYWDHKCSVCRSERKLELDHWIPLKHPHCPGTIATNLIILCKSCNCSKGAKHPTDWLIYKLSNLLATQKLAEIQTYFEYVKNRNSEE
jgi:5-methylcytosine-specific restriction endonuclease McrA